MDSVLKLEFELRTMATTRRDEGMIFRLILYAYPNYLWTTTSARGHRMILETIIEQIYPLLQTLTHDI